MSRFILVVGESTAGKTRLAYEAIRARLPGHMLIRPELRARAGSWPSMVRSRMYSR